MINKPWLLKFTLYLGATYYFIGSVVHWFGLTLFPFYDSKLYTPYHDSVIAITALFLSLLLITVAHNPLKNIDILKIIIPSAIVASFFSIAIIWKVDFVSLGAPDKELQTIVEGLLGFVWVGLLIYLYPKKSL